MKKLLGLLGLVVCVGIVSAAQALPFAQQNGESEKGRVQEAISKNLTDPNKTILVHSNAPIVALRLKSNPTTGYSWFLRGYDPNFVVLKKHQFEPLNEQKPGVGGTEVWYFEIKPLAFKAPHLFEIDLLYARPWELRDNSTRAKFIIITGKNPIAPVNDK